MRNKRAQVFSFILVLITLFMCGASIYVYSIQQGNAANSLVSPLVVLETRDSLDVFEMRERELIEKSLKEVDEKFGSENFPEKFRDVFIDNLMTNEEMKEFILSDLTWNGALMKSEEFDEESFLRNILYSKVEKDSNVLKITRSKIGKNIPLSSQDKIKINFPVDFSFEFEREYTITFEKGKFEVKAAW